MIWVGSMKQCHSSCFKNFAVCFLLTRIFWFCALIVVFVSSNFCWASVYCTGHQQMALLNPYWYPTSIQKTVRRSMVDNQSPVWFNRQTIWKSPRLILCAFVDALKEAPQKSRLGQTRFHVVTPLLHSFGEWRMGISGLLRMLQFGCQPCCQYSNVEGMKKMELQNATVPNISLKQSCTIINILYNMRLNIPLYLSFCSLIVLSFLCIFYLINNCYVIHSAVSEKFIE